MKPIRNHPIAIADAASLASIFIGVTALIGWAGPIPFLTHWSFSSATLKSGTALTFIVLGGSLFLKIRGKSRSTIRLGDSLALAAIIFSTLMLFEIASGWDSGLSRAIGREVLGFDDPESWRRMAPNTAAGLCLLSASVMAYGRNGALSRLAAGAFPFLALLIAFIAIASYIFGAHSLESIAGFASMAFPTAVALLVFSVSLIVVASAHGIGQVATSDTKAGRAFRRQIVTVVLVMVILGHMRLAGQRANYFGTEFGVAILVAASVIIFSIIAYINARTLLGEEARESSEQRLRAFVLATTEAIRASTAMNEASRRMISSLGEYLSLDRAYVVRVHDQAADVIAAWVSDARPTADPTAALPDVRGWLEEVSRGPLVAYPDFNPECRNEEAGGERLRSLIAVPLFIDQGRVVAALLGNLAPRTWKLHELDLIRSLADKVMFWFENLIKDEQLLALNQSLESQVIHRTQELTKALQEREVLLQEVHHRVKNNLQVVASLISLQLRMRGNQDTRTSLLECQSRIMAIALIHERLYQEKNYARVDFRQYITALAENLVQSIGTTQPEVRLNFEIEDITMTVEKGIPCGLIVNELVTNALKHAFPGAAAGTINIVFRRLDEQFVCLSVQDTGKGLPKEWTMDGMQSLGLVIVSTLSRQLDGEVAAESNNGARFSVRFRLAA